MHKYFPAVEEVGPFGPAFLHLMFAYAEFERRVGELQKVITGKPSISETYHWGAQERPKRMRKLILANAKRISVPPDHVTQIVKVLKQAISPSDLRNLLVHGDWWILHADGQIITVRRDKLRRGKKRFEDIKIEEISRNCLNSKLNSTSSNQSRHCSPTPIAEIGLPTQVRQCRAYFAFAADWSPRSSTNIGRTAQQRA
jgi:hypothetical protein